MTSYQRNSHSTACCYSQPQRLVLARWVVRDREVFEERRIFRNCLDAWELGRVRLLLSFEPKFIHLKACTPSSRIVRHRRMHRLKEFLPPMHCRAIVAGKDLLELGDRQCVGKVRVKAESNVFQQEFFGLPLERRIGVSMTPLGVRLPAGLRCVLRVTQQVLREAPD